MVKNWYHHEDYIFVQSIYFSITDEANNYKKSKHRRNCVTIDHISVIWPVTLRKNIYFENFNEYQYQRVNPSP